jgi:lipoprotein-anchoring transpeptidase ErfK/SrfK
MQSGMTIRDPKPSQPYPVSQAPPASSFSLQRSWAVWIVLVVGSLLLIAISLPVIVGLGGYVYYQMSGRIAPGVRVGNTQLGWMTTNQAAVVLHKEWNMERKLLVSDGLQSWTLAPADLGLSVDAIQTARSAYGVARRQAMWNEFSQMTRSWLSGWQVAPVASVGLEKARSGLQTLNMQASKAPIDAALVWDGNELAIIPGELGYAINISETLHVLETNPEMVLASGYLQLPLMPVIPAIADVSAAMAQAEQLINTPLRLSAYDPVRDDYLHWDISRYILGSMLTFEAGADGPQVAIDEDKLGAYINQLGQSLGDDRWLDGVKYQGQLAQAIESKTNLLIMVSHRPTLYTVQPGDTLISIGWKVGMPLWKILQANPDLEADALQAGETLVIPSKDELLPLPVIPNKRIVIGIGEQRLWVYQDGQLLSKNVISTGIDRSPTQPGIFQVQTHELEAYASVWDLYMPHFLGVYEAWPGFMNGIHGLPTLSNGRRLWANILGKPASYGCIIMDLEAAEWLYDWAEDGVVVEIRQ